MQHIDIRPLLLQASAARALAVVDWVVIGSYFALSLGIAIYFTKRAGRNTSEFFLGGRRLGWFLAGTGMVATTFAADTPLAVTELVAQSGIAGNWLWWNFLVGGMLTVFFFARLWRRAHVLTDVEFIELRYSGPAAAVLRGFKAIYLGLFINCVVLAWVNKAMITIVQICLPTWNAQWAVAAVLLIVAFYSMLSGLMGVTVTDAFQFFLAMAGCIVLAVYAVNDAGGIARIRESLPDSTFRFTPVIGADAGEGSGVLSLTLTAFIAYMAVVWWASWYPGAEPGGGGYVVQRMASAKDEKNSVFATLWFMIAHYCVRPWPWILTALAALVVLPQLPVDQRALVKGDSPEARAFQSAALERAASDPTFAEAYQNAKDPRGMFPLMMQRLLPAGLYGLLIAAFLAAYMSTIATQLNWGTSYIVNDFYRRFVSPEASERHAVLVSRLLTLAMAGVSIWVTGMVDAISGAWQFVLAISGGIGAVLILRWYWWRVNAAAEIAAMLAPVVPYVFCEWRGIRFPTSLFIIVGFATLAWIAIMYLTAPTDRDVLHRFFRRVHPGGPGWSRIARELPDVKPDTGYAWLFIDWILGCVLVYAFLFGLGKLLLGDVLRGLGLIALGVLAGGVIWWDLSRSEWTEHAKQDQMATQSP
jgi:Na+/proline symporter